jgi:hypothetical protein
LGRFEPGGLVLFPMGRPTPASIISFQIPN